MVNKNLQQVIDDIYKEKDKLAKQIENETDEYRKHDLNFEFSTVQDEKFHKIFLEMLENIPEDRVEELKPIMVKVIGSEDNYERFSKNVLTHIPNASLKEIFKGMPSATVVSAFDETIESLSDFVSDEDMNQVAKTVKNFVPGAIDNTPIHPLGAEIEKIKKGEKFGSLSQKEKTLVSKQLDEINEIVKESPRRFSDAQTSFDSDYEHIANKTNDEFFKEFINQDKNFGKAFSYRDLNFKVKDDVAGDEEKVAIAKSPSFKLSESTKNSVLRVWKKMDELGIISAGEGKESGRKIYGFEKLYNARANIDNALSSEQFDNLQELKNEYEKQLQNVREMYRIIKTEFNPTPDKIPGNVQNFRENFVPAEFKNDICTNATFNGMYNTYSIVKRLGITAEEFLQNPQEYIEKNFNEELTKFHIDKYYKDLPFNETLARVYSDKPKPEINSHGLPRMIATLSLFEDNEENRKNDLIYHAVQSGKIENIYSDEQVCYNYFAKGRTNSFVNLLFVNDEDKDFYKLKSHDGVTGDKLQKTKAFDLASYIKEKNISAETINERLISFFSTAYKLAHDSEVKYAKDKKYYDAQMKLYREKKIKVAPEHPDSKLVSREDFASMVKDAEQGVLAFAMLANPERDKGLEKLVGFLKDPAKALESINMSPDFVKELDGLKKKDVLLEQCKQQAKIEGVLDIEEIRNKEKEYKLVADKILKDANKISKKVAKEKNANRVEELQKQSVLKLNELKQLQKTETERLEKEYKEGKIPAEYYKKRVENIVSLKHAEKVAIFDDGLDKKQYIKSTGLEKLSRGEANRLFECEVEKQKYEKELFMNTQFLQKNNLISTNKDISVQQANFAQIDVSEIDSGAREQNREPIVVDEAKIKNSAEKTEPQKEIDPKQTVKMP